VADFVFSRSPGTVNSVRAVPDLDHPGTLRTPGFRQVKASQINHAEWWIPSSPIFQPRCEDYEAAKGAPYGPPFCILGMELPGAVKGSLRRRWRP
jgi:hypothetical protein